MKIKNQLCKLTYDGEVFGPLIVGNFKFYFKDQFSDGISLNLNSLMYIWIELEEEDYLMDNNLQEFLIANYNFDYFKLNNLNKIEKIIEFFTKFDKVKLLI